MAFSFTLSGSIGQDECVCDQLGGSLRTDFLTIHAKRKRVVWYSAGGGRVIRFFTFPKVPKVALFCQFHTPTDNQAASSVKNAVAVVLADNELCIHMFSGEVHNIVLPAALQRMLAIPGGLLLHMLDFRSGPDTLMLETRPPPCACFYSLSNPAAPLLPISITEIPEDLSLDSLSILCITDDIVCTHSTGSGALQLWKISRPAAGLPLVDASLSLDISMSMQRSAVIDVESALNILDGSVSQYQSLMPTSNDAMSMLMQSDSFLAGERPDRFMESFTADISRVGRASLGGERSLNELSRLSASSPAALRASPVHMLLSGSGEDASAHLQNSTPNINAGSPKVGNSSSSLTKPYGPLLKEAGHQPYRLTHSPATLLSGSGFQRSRLAFEDASPLAPLNLSRASVGRSGLLSGVSLNQSSSMQQQQQREMDTDQPAAAALAGDCRMAFLHSIQLPFAATSLECSFSGSPAQLGGLHLHCVDRQRGTYFRYAIGTGEEVSCIDETSRVSLELCEESEGLSVSHLTVPLQLESGVASCGTAGPAPIPVTLLLHPKDHTVTLVIGSVKVGDLSLEWVDDMSDGGPVSGLDVQTLGTVQTAGLSILASSQCSQRIIKAPLFLFGGTCGNIVCPEADYLTAVMAVFGAKYPEVVGTVLGLLLEDSSVNFLALLASICNVSFDVYCHYVRNQLNVEPMSARNTVAVQCYSTLPHVLGGEEARLELLRLCHLQLQEYVLRFDEDVSGAEKLRVSLARLMDLLALNRSPDAAGPYFELYCSSGSGANRTGISSLWFQRCLHQMQSADRAVEQFPIPAASDGSLTPYPTLRLTGRFFNNFLAAAADSKASSAVRIMDAFVASLLEAGRESNPTVDWLSLLSLVPSLLRTMLELSLTLCRECPSAHWPDFVLKVIGRNDLCESTRLTKRGPVVTSTDTKISLKGEEVLVSDGLAEVESASRLRFTEDERMHEVCRMLRSSVSIYLKLEKAPEISELDHRVKLQHKLMTLCRRSLACPVGRGMLTMSSLEPLIAESLPIPVLSLTGKVAPTNFSLPLELSHATPDLTLWPEFHNGVAAALRVGPQISKGDGPDAEGPSASSSSKVTRNWIIYNRTASQAKAGGESAHAGFLFGLGLHGHLSVLSVTDICDYLVQGHEPTTIAILLGSTASKLGSADPMLSKTLSLHLPALLPAQHWDIEISPLVQTAALVGMGLLYCGTGHRVMTEFLLAELSRRPSSDRCESREAMILASCWSLGMVLLGRGNDKPYQSDRAKGGGRGVPLKGAGMLGGLADLRVEERLLLHIDGGKKPAESSLFPSHSASIDISSKSSKVLEGNDINVDVTSPGACIALALIYLRSGNADILSRMQLPSTLVHLDSIRPDLLLYKAVARTLIMWDSVVPSEEWLCAQVPVLVTKSLFAAESKTAEEAAREKVATLFDAYNKSHRRCKQVLEGRTAFMLYLNILAGHCWGMGLVFAGTSDAAAKKTILGKLQFLQGFRDNRPPVKLSFPMDKSLRFTLEMCVGVVSMSLACVMAGSGDLQCLRLVRELRFRTEDTTYGTHMALGMSIGLLFLAGGNSSLRRDPLSTGCLLMAMCPRYPALTVDHQYHLQPLRHLYVLATEQRALHTIDVDTGLPVALNVEVEMVDGRRIVIRAPGLLPELSSVRRVSVTMEAQLEDDATGRERGDLYYATSLALPSPPSKSPFDRSQLRSIHTQRQLPELLVKRVPASSHAAESSTASLTALAALRDILFKTLAPFHFRKVEEALLALNIASTESSVRKSSLEQLLVHLEDPALGALVSHCRPLLGVLAEAVSG